MYRTIVMKKIDLKNIVWKEGKYYVSWNLNTGISSFGASKKAALTALQEALELYFEDMPLSKVIKIERPDIVRSELKYA
ncbi:MAG: type II toxin-antitoxin system HicB family antitoxin [Candidatus Komeilibacteria bacterium]